MYIRYFQQGHHHTYGHIRCRYTVLANPIHTAHCRAQTAVWAALFTPARQKCAVYALHFSFALSITRQSTSNDGSAACTIPASTVLLLHEVFVCLLALPPCRVQAITAALHAAAQRALCIFALFVCLLTHPPPAEYKRQRQRFTQ